MKKPISKQHGQTIVEIVFVLGLSFVILSGLVVSIIFTAKAGRFSKNKSAAVRLAQEKIEEFKTNKRLTEFWNNPSDYGCGATEVSLGENSIYSRQTQCSFLDSENKEMKVVVVASWEDGGAKTVTMATILSNLER